jgi:hypothetical protein
MSDQTQAPPAAIGVSVVLAAVTLLIWAITLGSLTDLTGSDPAGNAMAQGLTGLALIVIWILLAVSALIAVRKGAIPRAAGVAALVLIPVSGVVAMMALDLLTRPSAPPFFWPIVIPALIPPLVVASSLWGLFPQLRAAVAPRNVAFGAWGLTAILCAAILPLQQVRDTFVKQQRVAAEKSEADLKSVPANSPLWVWTPFLDTRNEVRRREVLDRIRRLDRRQGDAETMLDRGDFPLRYLGAMDIEPTPAICDKARNLLRQRAAALAQPTPGSKSYATIDDDVAGAVAAMNWLVGYECSCDAESRAWEATVKAYNNPSYDAYRLAEIRDPKNFGRTLRERPSRFSMLSPKSHLKAWLKFADDDALREQALAGARKLDHRTADAIEMLGDNDFFTPSRTIRYLPVLDLEATPSLCAAGLKQVGIEFTKVYRPKPDDPRSYRELLDRLGVHAPLTALAWLAQNGCAADAMLSEADSLVRTYQDSPDRAAMLDNLARLRRKPQ